MPDIEAAPLYPRGDLPLRCDGVAGDTSPCDKSWVYAYAYGDSGTVQDEWQVANWCDRHLVVAIQLKCYDVGIIANQPD